MENAWQHSKNTINISMTCGICSKMFRNCNLMEITQKNLR